MSDLTERDLFGSDSASSGSQSPQHRNAKDRTVIVEDENAMSGEDFYTQSDNQEMYNRGAENAANINRKDQVVDEPSQAGPSKTSRKRKASPESTPEEESDKENTDVGGDDAENQRPTQPEGKAPAVRPKARRRHTEAIAEHGGDETPEAVVESDTLDSTATITPPTRRRQQSASPRRTRLPTSRGREGRPKDGQSSTTIAISAVSESPLPVTPADSLPRIDANLFDDDARQGDEGGLRAEPEDNTQIYEEYLEKFLQQREQAMSRRAPRRGSVPADPQTSESRDKGQKGSSQSAPMQSPLDATQPERSPEPDPIGRIITVIQEDAPSEQSRVTARSPSSSNASTPSERAEHEEEERPPEPTRQTRRKAIRKPPETATTKRRKEPPEAQSTESLDEAPARKERKDSQSGASKTGGSRKKETGTTRHSDQAGTSRTQAANEDGPAPAAKSGKSKSNRSKRKLPDTEPTSSTSRKTTPEERPAKTSAAKSDQSKGKKADKEQPDPASKPSTSKPSKKQAEIVWPQPSKRRRKGGRTCVACRKTLTWNYHALKCTLCHRERCRLCLDCPCEDESDSPRRHDSDTGSDESGPTTSQGLTRSSKASSSKQSKEPVVPQRKGRTKRKERTCVVCGRKMHFNYRSVVCDLCKRERCRGCQTCVCEDSD